MMTARAFIKFFEVRQKLQKNMFLLKKNQCKNENKIKRKKKNE